MSELSTPILELQKVTRRDNDQVLLDQISFQVAKGERIAISGPSGSGKSLLLRSLAMLDAIDSGKFFWKGQAVTSSQVPFFRSQVMYLHQRSPLSEGTVLENLQLPYTLQVHKSQQFDQTIVEQYLQQLDRDTSFLAKQQKDLSGGESQIVAFLRVLQLNPQVLLLDEPTAALDQATTQQFESLLHQWIDVDLNNRSYVWVSHDPSQVQRVATRVLSIEKGQLTGDQHE